MGSSSHVPVHLRRLRSTQIDRRLDRWRSLESPEQAGWWRREGRRRRWLRGVLRVVRGAYRTDRTERNKLNQYLQYWWYGSPSLSRLPTWQYWSQKELMSYAEFNNKQQSKSTKLREQNRNDQPREILRSEHHLTLGEGKRQHRFRYAYVTLHLFTICPLRKNQISCSPSMLLMSTHWVSRWWRFKAISSRKLSSSV